MNKKKLLVVGVISMLVVLNGVFYLEGQRLQRTKLSLETEVQDLEKSLKDKATEYENLVVEHGNCPQWTSLGEFKITTYCSCYECNGKWTGYPTKLGTDYVEGRTVGVDENIIPLGSKLLIDGNEYVAEDTGSFSGKVIDVYVSDHSKFYRDYKEVYILEEK